MTLSINVIQNLENNKVLLKETSGTKKKSIERFYVAKQDDADKFIMRRKTIEKANKFQKIMTGVLTVSLPLFVAATTTLGAFAKTIAVLGTGLITYFGSKAVDKKMDEHFHKSAMEDYNITEVTDKIKDI